MSKESKKLPQLVQIRRIDTHQEIGKVWHDKEETDDLIKPIEIWTCGYLVKETSEHVTLSQSYNPEYEQNAGIITIPRSLIQEMKGVRFRSTPEKDKSPLRRKSEIELL